MFIGPFHSMQAYLYQYDTVIQLVSYQSIVAKYGYVEDGNTHAMILNHWTIQFSNKYPNG